MDDLSRREFVKVGTLSAITLSQLPSASAAPGNIPIIICSRGEAWGKKVLEPAWQTWLEKKNMLDAIEKGANVVELDPEDNTVGYGGLPNEEGIVELDASVMSGPGHHCGAVASLHDIKRACSVARVVMERTNHSMLVGDGAKRFAVAYGFPEENLLTDASRKAWIDWKENLNKEDNWGPRPTGTINVLGIDNQGNAFGITTTSGLAFKIPGRVGDSPIIGAGLYVDNETGAAGATGFGEEVIRTCGSFLVVDQMKRGLSPQQACEYAAQRIIDVNGGKTNRNVKFIAVNKQGQVGCSIVVGKETPVCSIIDGSGFRVVVAKALLKQD